MPSSSATARKESENRAISNAQRSIAKKVYIPKRSRQKVKVTATGSGLAITSK